MDVMLVMHSLDVFRSAGGIGKPNVDTTNIRFCGIGKRRVFEAVASGGAGDLRFAMNPAQTESEVSMSSIIGCVTDLGSKGCGDLRARFWFELFGECFIGRCVHSW